MGYSSTVRASLTMQAINMLDEFDIASPNYKYFAEIGRENVDGSITGIVYELIGDMFIDEQRNVINKAKKAGSFKINANGSIQRFPGVSKRMFGVIEIASIENYDRNYSMRVV